MYPDERNLLFQVLIVVAITAGLGFFFGGCDLPPESFHLQDVPCVITPGTLYLYDCEKPGFARCLDSSGNTKYEGCAIDSTVYTVCVTTCEGL